MPAGSRAGSEVERCLFGVETEYALFAPAGARRSAEELGAALLDGVRRRRPWLRDATDYGMFLGNGSRLYLDCGRHPELATPECSSPWEVVAAVRAGERILEEVLRALGADPATGEGPALTRCNVDYSGSGATWGSHESYLHRADPALLARQLVPHLVSRLVYAGAGGFEAQSPGVEFTLSPRAGFLKSELSKESTTMRGIVHTKNETLSTRGTHRLHLLCGESLGSQAALLLKIGTTALIVALIDSGGLPALGVELARPLEALRSFASDPTCRATAPLANGGVASALDLQRHYLERVEAVLDSGRLPSWAPALCARWRRTLETLASGPEAVATSLDWAIKWSLYRRFCRPPFDWTRLAAWNRVAAQLAQAVAALGDQGVPTYDRLAGAEPATLDAVARAIAPALSSERLRATELAAFLRRRAELFEADFRFGQLGERGIFEQLDRAGGLDHRVVSVPRIEAAIERPPGPGRAQVRGEWVRRLGSTKRSRFICDWCGITDHERSTALALGDPFAESGEWRVIQRDDPQPPAPGVPVAEVRPDSFELVL